MACRTLRRAGIRIVARNYVCPHGEIDIVGLDGNTLVFVEVKARLSDRLADPEVNVTAAKRAHLTAAARSFIAQTDCFNLPARHDIISIVLPERGKPQIEHFVDAFPAVPNGPTIPGPGNHHRH